MQACSGCNECIRACPNNQPIPEAMKAAAEGNLEPFAEILDECVGCARCDSACPKDFPLHSFMVKAGEEKVVGREVYDALWTRCISKILKSETLVVQ